MGDIAVRVEGLGKKYWIGKAQERHVRLYDALADAIAAPFRRVSQLMHGNVAGAVDLTETIWALKDVSFEIKKGEVIGIIGRNGAGKSTLLKILSRITSPSKGRAEVFGRIGALLEVGTGFHPDLTGRENIYLNGSILGMSRQVIERKFDEIVAFAGVEKFVDTPVKHYSSGMGLRLGFAVAAHLEPEILIVDEVLAVGDAEFQKKCLGKMSNIAGEGRTVLFVSHNMAAVMGLCPRSLMLRDGQILRDGETNFVIDEYIRLSASSKPQKLITQNLNEDDPFIESAKLSNGVHEITSITTNSTLCIEVVCNLGSILPSKATLGFKIKDTLGSTISASHFGQYKNPYSEEKRVVFSAVISELPLNVGFYTISLYLSDGTSDKYIAKDALEFEVLWNNDIDVNYQPYKHWGPLFIPVSWSMKGQNELCLSTPQES